MQFHSGSARPFERGEVMEQVEEHSGMDPAPVEAGPLMVSQLLEDGDQAGDVFFPTEEVNIIERTKGGVPVNPSGQPGALEQKHTEPLLRRGIEDPPDLPVKAQASDGLVPVLPFQTLDDSRRDRAPAVVAGEMFEEKPVNAKTDGGGEESFPVEIGTQQSLKTRFFFRGETDPGG